VYEFLRGRVVEIRPGEVVLATGTGEGVGWLLQVSSATAAALREGEEALLRVHLAVSENALALYGFASAEERRLFRLLLQVGGVGPALALALLSAFPPGDLAARILEGDHRSLTRVKGVGRKTAERLVLELKDRLGALAVPVPEQVPGSAADPGVEEDLVRVLLDLGFRPSEARAAAAATLASLGPGTDFQELLRSALQTRTP